ncbi:unknown protein [Seminavis robusta]|uniref:Uncharacterized protein n=1 Tax=Seminavis robusta TaxID=568900 RepID=A0A9N8HPR0_9STRA|nr:unknown protein [Seminavis robusta]|eukprot:Sro1119_g243170.1 n/a (194) ;mRNA; r:10309-10890
MILLFATYLLHNTKTTSAEEPLSADFTFHDMLQFNIELTQAQQSQQQQQVLTMMQPKQPQMFVQPQEQQFMQPQPQPPQQHQAPSQQPSQVVQLRHQQTQVVQLPQPEQQRAVFERQGTGSSTNSKHSLSLKSLAPDNDSGGRKHSMKSLNSSWTKMATDDFNQSATEFSLNNSVHNFNSKAHKFNQRIANHQ